MTSEKEMKKPMVLLWLFAVLPTVVVAFIYSKLPMEIPTQWGINGNVTYGPRETIWFMCMMPLFITAIFSAIPKIDPRRSNYAKFAPHYKILIFTMLLFFDVILGMILVESFYPDSITIRVFVPCLVGMLFVVIGNLMPKMKSNFFLGIRTPWALSNETVWFKTQRLGGKLFFLCGLLEIALAFILPEVVNFYALMSMVAVTVVVPVVMSYVWYLNQAAKTQQKKEG